MPADFIDANGRHTDDAERLFQVERYANADHLFGIAAECGLKCLMAAFGMPVEPATGDPKERTDKQHVDALWVRYESYRYGHHSGAGYVLPAVNPFADWQASQRYERQDQFDADRVEPHRHSAIFIQRLVSKAQSEGLL
ncbi:MAG: SAM-dependent methyltransferase [Niveispirillum sp.]|uniref:hypothetical protein n=1 Tax=Alphaproteobacteria TaxID=28211 RepID=UPI0026374581|nr:hypothetical protein [Asticcacaulis sp.]